MSQKTQRDSDLPKLAAPAQRALAGAGVDRIIHEPSRLVIMALLYWLESADFLFVMRQVGLTQGNLSSHLAKLEAGGYIEVDKHFEGKRPVTTLRLSNGLRRLIWTHMSFYPPRGR